MRVLWECELLTQIMSLGDICRKHCTIWQMLVSLRKELSRKRQLVNIKDLKIMEKNLSESELLILLTSGHRLGIFF